MKKIKLALVYAIAIAAVGCSQEDDALLSTNPPHPESLTIPTVSENGYEVTITELSNIIKERNGGSSRAEISTITAIKGEDGQPALYVINYGINSGWQIISASKNTQPLLAYSDEGHFDVNELPNMPLGLANWIDNATIIVEDSYALDPDLAKEARASWRRYEKKKGISRFGGGPDDIYPGPGDYNPQDILKYISQDEYDKLISIMNDSIYSWNNQGYEVTICDADYMEEHLDFFHEIQGSIYGPYTDAVCMLTFRLYRQWADVHSNQLIYSTWDQGYPYNQSFVDEKNNGFFPVGCGPLAVGQIMRYYQYPSFFNWSNMPLNDGNKTTSDFLLDVAEKCKAKYTSEATSVEIEDAKNAMSKYGYETSNIQHLNSGDRLPSIGYMRAYIKFKDEYRDEFKKDGGHAWVLGGSSSVVEMEETLYYSFRERLQMDTFTYGDCWPSEISHYDATYMVWGWGSRYDGFYSNSAISLPAAKKLEDIKYFSVSLPNK